MLYHLPGGNRNRHEKRVPPPGKSRSARSPPAAPGSGSFPGRGDRAGTRWGGGRSVGASLRGRGGREKRREPRGRWGLAPLSGGPGAHVCGSAPQRSPRKRVVWSRGGTPLLLPGLYSVWGPRWVLAVWEEPRMVIIPLKALHPPIPPGLTLSRLFATGIF